MKEKPQPDNWAFWISIFGVILSFASGGISYLVLRQSEKQQEQSDRHQRLSMRPYLFMMNNNENGPLMQYTNWSLLLNNSCAGSAIIKTVTIYISDREIGGNQESRWQRALTEAMNYPVYLTRVTNIGKGFCLGEGQSITLVEFGVDPKLNEEVRKAINAGRVVIKYASLYDDEILLMDTNDFKGTEVEEKLGTK